MIATIDAAFVRLAYPLKSAAFAKLADSKRDIDELASLMLPFGSLSASDAEAYVAQPFHSPTVSRFSNGSYGVLYAGDSLRTAVKEKCYHLARYFRDASSPAQTTRQVRLLLHMTGPVRDVRRSVDRKSVSEAIYSPTDYAAAQTFGAKIQDEVPGVYYNSVRHAPQGQCIGAFTPQLVRHAEILGDLQLLWDGRRFSEERTIEPLGE